MAGAPERMGNRLDSLRVRHAPTPVRCRQAGRPHSAPVCSRVMTSRLHALFLRCSDRQRYVEGVESLAAGFGDVMSRG